MLETTQHDQQQSYDCERTRLSDVLHNANINFRPKTKKDAEYSAYSIPNKARLASIHGVLLFDLQTNLLDIIQPLKISGGIIIDLCYTYNYDDLPNHNDNTRTINFSDLLSLMPDNDVIIENMPRWENNYYLLNEALCTSTIDINKVLEVVGQISEREVDVYLLIPPQLLHNSAISKMLNSLIIVYNKRQSSRLSLTDKIKKQSQIINHIAKGCENYKLVDYRVLIISPNKLWLWSKLRNSLISNRLELKKLRKVLGNRLICS